MHIPDIKLAQVLDRFDQIAARMNATTDSDEIVQLGKDYAELKPIADGVRKLRDVRSEMEDLEGMMKDPEMAAMAKEEMQSLKDSLPALEKEVSLLLLPKDKDDNASIVLEIRAGTGGDEAAIFAGDLFSMYARYASLQGWKVEIESQADADMGGYKEIIASVSGAGAYGKMKFESGVHRVQRVPVTETQGRVHTSAATVAVLPEPEDVDIGFSMGDVRVDTMRASGAGGQHVNKTDSAVRMTHIPTGVVVVCDAKSQHMNRANAERLLKMKLYDMEKQRIDAERAEERAGQVGSGDRSERIRTYNYPQGRVTDHRIGLTLYNLDKIVAGDALSDVVDMLMAEDQAARLAQMEAG
ncbi:peptide chain release factor 1 (bRF-1) [Litorimonas taeanensis]|uniref:Peptide chain release factor 1 n=1 Tax=Litorimonas taeanensis TaxID=568099 RepID=A0A420WLP0_9PROT|nr:peptide chain release factor 1 [Litorimonas taeanensis]RKQ71795.1 peptide chain release factor 1 (bRF-1) [Litorimonas taeanensis]